MMFRTESPGKWNRMGTGIAVVFLLLNMLFGIAAVQAETGQEDLIAGATGTVVSAAAAGPWADVFEVTDPARLDWAGAVCALVSVDALLVDEQGMATLTTDAYKQNGLSPCADHPFALQPVAALGAGFAVGDDLILTAGGYESAADALAAYRFVFGFALADATSVSLSFEADQVYSPVEIIAGDDSFTLLRVDRPVSVAHALPLAEVAAVAGDDAVVIAYPAGLPAKITTASLVATADGLGVVVDPLGDLSGAPVILSATGEVAGVLNGGVAVSAADAPCFSYGTATVDGAAGSFTPASAFASLVSDSLWEKQVIDIDDPVLNAEGEEEEQIDGADFNMESLVRDGEALLPLHDWVPLFRFSMSYGDDSYAPRYLSELVYTLKNDDPDDRDYMVRPYLDQSDILEFALFWDDFNDDDEAGEARYGSLDTSDYMLRTWDNTGAPYGTVNGLTYSLDFTGQNIDAWPQIDDVLPDGAVYIVAVRTSHTWRSSLTLGVEVTMARMVEPETGTSNTGGENDPDSYSPDFFGGEKLEADEFYSASFGVYDPTGPDLNGLGIAGNWENIPTPNFFQYTPYMSIPLAEFSRPRWNKSDSLMSIGSGVFMNIRPLIPLESWMPIIGINLHSTRSLYSGIGDDDFPYAELREVNVVLTDSGGDPYGPPGNGGFNPKEALKPVYYGSADASYTSRRHVAMNGLWVWEDTNRNGVFDSPSHTFGAGFSYNGDMALSAYDENYDWEYISEPEGGGDPWWKIKLTFVGHEDGPGAFIREKTPNNYLPGEIGIGSEFSYDYFVVARLDSGFKDSSSTPSGNAGAPFGAEFQAFIEPRRYDHVRGNWEGGIYATSQIFRRDIRDFYDREDLGMVWQDEPAWGDEPWWTERTMNINTSKRHRQGLEVLDLVHTYMGEVDMRRYEEIFAFNHFPNTLINTGRELHNLALGFGVPGAPSTSITSMWLDPFGLGANRFLNHHEPDVFSFAPIHVVHSFNLGDQTIRMGGGIMGLPQFSFETKPFYFELDDAPPLGPRSAAYPIPDPPTTVPHYNTWPGSRLGSELPRLSDWFPEDASSRLLTQKIERRSKHVPMLGFNMVGSTDIVVNEEGNGVALAELNVAFWGPDFTPEILRPLDPDKNHNESLASGVLLWQRTGTLGEGETNMLMGSYPILFVNTEEVSYYGDTPIPLQHKMIPVTSLRWGTMPEYIDIDGDGRPDDMNGDGIVDDRDKAWVLTFRPTNNWQVPQDDASGTTSGGVDLVLSVKTSDAIARFQKFRALVPATLPDRAADRRKAGIQFWPQVNTNPSAYTKVNPEEGPVQAYYGHDMIEANVPAAVVDMTGRWTDLHAGGAALPLLGIDVATNTQSTRESGSGGTGQDQSFHVAGARWKADVFAGDVLVDERYESYEILGNSADMLYLLSGKPRNGAWRIVENPTYLEEVSVELYQEGSHDAFNPLTDLLPLDIDQQVSGVAIYRDNDNHPQNRNGVFDPDIDIPLSLDAPPRFMGQAGDAIKVRFCFSLPGTGDFPKSRDRQPRNRQWIYDGFGSASSDYENGPDFFIVIRAANDMHVGDSLRAGIVSWGPATPTEPDPHIWANLPGEERHGYKKFREFLWTERGLGFVTYFKEPQLYYYMDESRAGQRADSSGYNWIRSHSAVKGRSGIVTARKRPVGPRSTTIDAVSQHVLPVQTFAGAPFDFLINGTNFGKDPVVALSGYEVTVLSASNEEIHVSIETRDGIIPQEPITLVVRNTQTGDEVSRSDLFSLSNTVSVNGPRIFSVSPKKATKEDFPVTVKGANFGGNDFMAVLFGETLMPVLDVSTDGSSMTIGWPQGGLPVPGKMNVSVRTQGVNGGHTVMVDAFEYVNPEIRNKAGLLGCGAAPESSSSGWTGDLALLALLGAVLTFSRRRFRSFSLLLAVALIFAVTPGHAFFPRGGWNLFQQLRFATWAFNEFDTDENGTVDLNEGLEFRIEGGPRGFTPAEINAVRAAFDTWENVPTSYVAFRFAGTIEEAIIPASIGTDYLPMVYMQVTDVAADDTYSLPDEADVLVPELNGTYSPALTFVFYTIDGTILEVGGNSVMVPGGTILDCDIVVNANMHRPGLIPTTTFGVLDLQATMTQAVGQILGLGWTPLNNLDPFSSITVPGGSEGLPVEPAVLQMTGADGIARAVGATPTMFPFYFLTETEYGDYIGGWRDLAPDDISGVSWLYPRKHGQSNFFSISQEVRTHVRRTTGIPPAPISGAHVVAWASLSSNDGDRRVPLFSTMSGLYQHHINLQLSGRFALHGLWKQLEVPGRNSEFYEPSYVLTMNPLNGIGYERQAPPSLSAAEFDSLQGSFPLSYSLDVRPSDYFTSGYPSEVFNEEGNIYGIDNNTVGTPLVWSFEKNTVISKHSGKTLPHILPTNVPMFGDADTVCPMNIIENIDGIGDTVTDGDTLTNLGATLGGGGSGGSGGASGGGTLGVFNEKLRHFRDNTLLRSRVGTLFVDSFFRISPLISAHLERSSTLLSIARTVTLAVATLVEFASWALLALVLAAAGLVAAGRKRNKAAVAATMIALILVFSTVSHAGQLPLPTETLVSRAEIIVTGTVLSAEARMDHRNRIMTDVVFKVQDVVKGNVNRGSNLVFSVTGGVYGTLAMSSMDIPNFAKDEKLLLYLAEVPGYGLMPHGGLRSKTNVFVDETTGEEVLDMARDNPEVGLPAEEETKSLKAKATEEDEDADEERDDQPQGSRPMPLSDYLEYLRGLVKNQRLR